MPFIKEKIQKQKSLCIFRPVNTILETVKLALIFRQWKLVSTYFSALFTLDMTVQYYSVYLECQAKATALNRQAQLSNKPCAIE
jgi:hypothetical protein